MNIIDSLFTRNFFRKRDTIIPSIIIITATIIYFINTYPLMNWVIDDAGITYVYARNLASGHGLVYQPGFDAVEGYSNFLWVLLLAPFFALKLFDPYLTPKIIDLLLVAFMFIQIYKILRFYTGRNYLIMIGVFGAIVFNAPFVIWACSGLENALYCFLIILLLSKIIIPCNDFISSNNNPIILGIIAFLISITRPDGVMYFVVLPLALIIASIVKEFSVRDILRFVGKYLIILAVTYGAFLGFRLIYFGNILPNTYYVKRVSVLKSLLDIFSLKGPYLNKLIEFVSSVSGETIWPIAIVVIITITILALRRKINRFHNIVLLFFLLTAGLIYMILPVDWMGEFRFAVPFYPLLYILLFVFSYHIVDNWLLSNNYKWVIYTFATIVMISVTIMTNGERLTKYQSSPPVRFSVIAERYGKTFNEYANAFGIDKGSLLVPDIGGTLYYSKLTIYDLGGLCDTTIAKYRGKDQQIFFDYIFEKTKPTFIHTHGYFTAVSKFDDDPRFKNDYVAISEYTDEYVKAKYREERVSGDFVRKDAIEGKESVLDSIKSL